MKYTIEMGSGVMMYIPNFIKIGSEIQKVNGGYTDIQRCRQHGDHINLLFFFKMRKVD
jgi:hypothetical protein